MEVSTVRINLEKLAERQNRECSNVEILAGS